MNSQQNRAILHIIDTTGPGGAETIFLNLVEQLHVDGYRNIALIKGPGWVEQQLKLRNIEYQILKPHGFLSIPYYLKLIRILYKQRVALVQAHLLGSILTSSIVCRICRIPLAATLHGQVDINPREKFVFIKQWLMATGVSSLIAVSRNLADYIHSRGLFRHKEIEVIYNGVDTKRYYRSTHSELKNRLHLNPDTILVGSLGNVRPAKNYELLIETAAILKQTGREENIHFLIAGHQRPELMKKLDALAAERMVTSMVHFLGFQDDTPKYLSELDLFLLCSSSEGFSIATIEAMASGAPVIATRCGGPEEIITDNVNGILLERNNPDLIAHTISLLIDDKNRREALITSAKNHIISQFSLNAMMERYRTIYSILLAGKRKGNVSK